MDTASLIGFIIFASIAAFTPGPNNLMLAASGANFGLRRTLPHITGVTIGFVSLVILACLGLASLFATLPGVMEVARWFSLLFLLYLAYKIATAAPPEGVDTQTTPINFIQAVLFQTINPKAVIVIISSVTTYASQAESLYIATIFITLIFAFVTITSTLLWAYAGSLFGRLLKNRQHLRIFNFTMAALLVASLAPASFNL